MKRVERPEQMPIVMSGGKPVLVQWDDFVDQVVFADPRWRRDWAHLFAGVDRKFRESSFVLSDAEYEACCAAVVSASVAQHYVRAMLPCMHAITLAAEA